MRATLRTTATALLLGTVAACADAPITAPLGETPPLAGSGGSEFSEQVSYSQLEAAAAAGALRLEVKLRSATAPLVAREVEREEEEALREDERIQSRVTAVAADGVTLELGGLRVGFDAATRFRAEGGDTLTQAAFVARLDSLLAAGALPALEARRPAPATPQAPEDPGFVASVLEIDDESGDPRLELNVDADNLAVGADSASGVLRVLGLSIEVRRGETEVEKRRDDARKRARFEGTVRSVDAAAGTLTLMDGRVVRIVEGTEIETGDDKLATLAEVQTALTAQQIVEAEGRGVVEGGTPVTILATEIEMEVEDDADHVPDAGRVRGEVASVDLAAGSFTLADGRVVRLVAGTKLHGDPKLRSLALVAAALGEQRRVSADVRGLLESAGPPATYVAIKARFHEGSLEDGDEGDEGEGDGAAEFEGRVTSVDVAAAQMVLQSGAIVRLTAETKIDGDLATLQAVADSLAAGRRVEVEGKGRVESEGPPRVLVATEVKFENDDD